jgi:uncharacterized damage-inducible protein DinB
VEKQELIEALQRSRASLLAVVAGLDDTAAAVRPTDDEWSVIEVLAHLVDTDYFYLGEALAAAATAGHHFRYFDDEAWQATHPEVRRLPLDAVLSSLAVSHRAVIDSVQRTPDDRPAQACIHPRGIPYTAGDAVHRLAPHDENHEQQLRQIIEAIRR